MHEMEAAKRLIVAADFRPTASNGREWVRTRVLTLADRLAGTGVIIKVNSALRSVGYSLIDELHARQLRVFADLKVYDIPATLTTDGALLRERKPEILTTVCSAGVSAMQDLKEALPETEVLGVTVLTSLTDADLNVMFSCPVQEAVMRFARLAVRANIHGLICSPGELEMLRSRFGVLLSLTTPGIRPAWAAVPNDDQNPERTMTPAQAIAAGADRIVVGRPIVNAKDPADAVRRTIEEIASAMTE